MKNKAFLIIAGTVLATLFGHVILYPPSQFHATDEATYAYEGQRVLEGKVPYVDFIENKPIGIYLIYALGIGLTPHSIIGIRVLSYLAMAATIIILLLWIYHKTSSHAILLFAGLISVSLFLQPQIEAEAMLTEQFSLPFIAFSIFWLDVKVGQKKSLKNLLIGGVAGGVSLLFTFFGLAPILGTIVIFGLKKWREYFTYLAVVMIIGLGWMLAYFFGGYLPEMYYSLISFTQRTIEYSIHQSYGKRLLQRIIFFSPLLVASIFAFWNRPQWKKEKILLSAWLMSSMGIFLYVRNFYYHQVMTLIIPIILLGSMGLTNLFFHDGSNHSRWKICLGIILLLLMGLFSVFPLNRTYSEPNDLHGIVQTVQKYSGKGDFIYVWGYQSEIYWYAQREAPTPFFHTPTLNINNNRAPIPLAEQIKLKHDFGLTPPKVMVVRDTEFLTNPTTKPFFEMYEPVPENQYIFRLKS